MAGQEEDRSEVRENRARHRFEIWVGDARAGFSSYEDRGGGAVAFTHTQIDPRFEHRGLAGRLISAALGAARDRGWQVLPECPFVRAHIEAHPDLVPLVPAERRAEFGLDRPA